MGTQLKNNFHHYEPCPNGCGNLKDVRAKQCRHCYHANRRIRQHRRPNQANPQPAKISREWMIQFAGLFMGEGTISLHPRNQGTSVGVKFSMSLRADDFALMDDIYEKLGGVVYTTCDAPRLNPVLRWCLTGLDDVEWLLRQLVASTIIPAKKLRDVKLCLEFIEWRKSVPYHFSPENRAIALSFVERLRSIRVFKVPDSQVVSVPLGSSDLSEGQTISSPGCPGQGT